MTLSSLSPLTNNPTLKSILFLAELRKLLHDWIRCTTKLWDFWTMQIVAFLWEERLDLFSVFPDACCSKLVRFCVPSTHAVDQQSYKPFWIFQSWSCLEYNVVKNKREKNSFSKHIDYSKNRQGEHRCWHTL